MKIDRFTGLCRENGLLRAVLYPAIAARRSSLNKKKTLRRELISNLGEILVADPVVKVEEFSGLFTVDPQSDLFFRLVVNKHYEPALTALCRKYLDPNRDIIDVGANIGFHTVMFAKCLSDNRRVLSLEPTKNALKRLRMNIEMNEVVEKVDVFEGVASNVAGTTEIKTIKGKEEYSSIGDMNHPRIANEEWVSETVVSVTLDELVKEKSLDPGFLKVDAEGAERLVFGGASNVLTENRPVVLSELSDYLLTKNGSSAQEVIDLIRGHDYDVFDPKSPSGAFKQKDFGDIMCFPSEMKIKPDFS